MLPGRLSRATRILHAMTQATRSRDTLPAWLGFLPPRAPEERRRSPRPAETRTEAAATTPAPPEPEAASTVGAGVVRAVVTREAIAMLWISKEQVDAFERELLETFADEMVEHARLYFPEQCSLMDEHQVRELIAGGIEKAQRYGIRTSRDVTLFLNLMFVFGADFDTNPSLLWSSRVFGGLHDGGVVSVDELYERAITDLRGDYE